MIYIETIVLKEAIKGLDIFLATASLGKGIKRIVGEIFKDDAVASIETLVGKICLASDNRSPKFNGLGLRKRRSGHP
jgi:hypothetical protein